MSMSVPPANAELTDVCQEGSMAPNVKQWQEVRPLVYSSK